MTTLSQVLIDDHTDLRPHLEALPRVADAIEGVPADEARAMLDVAVGFLVHRVLPHAAAEEATLYPAVERVFGAAGTSATMRRDHVEIGRLVDELATLNSRLEGTAPPAAPLVREARRILYGLAAVLALHLAKEEEIYLPLLEERLTPAEASSVAEHLHHAAVVSMA